MKSNFVRPFFDRLSTSIAFRLLCTIVGRMRQLSIISPRNAGVLRGIFDDENVKIVEAGNAWERRRPCHCFPNNEPGCEMKRAALSRLALTPEHPVHHFHERLRDTQPKPCASVVSCR